MKRRSPYAIDRARSYKKRRLATGRPYRKRNVAIAKVSDRPEYKNVDLVGSISLASGVTTWSPVAAGNLMNGMLYGTLGVGEHVGRKVTLKSVTVHWFVNMGSATTNGVSFRWVVVYDKQPELNFPAAGIVDIFETNNFNAMRALENTDRFIFLHDENTGPIAAQGNFTQSGKWSRKINLPQKFINTTPGAGTIADIETGAMYILAAHTGTAIGATVPQFQWTSRIRYTDC